MGKAYLSRRRASSPLLLTARGRRCPFFRFPERGMERREGARDLRGPFRQPCDRPPARLARARRVPLRSGTPRPPGAPSNGARIVGAAGGRSRAHVMARVTTAMGCLAGDRNKIKRYCARYQVMMIDVIGVKKLGGHKLEIEF